MSDDVSCAPAPGSYDVKITDAASKGPVSFEKTDRFRKKKVSDADMENEMLSPASIRRTLSNGNLVTRSSQNGEKDTVIFKELKRQKALEREVRLLIQQRGDQDKKIQASEEELRKVEAKLVVAVREKTGLAASIASLERQLGDLKRANDLLKTKELSYLQITFEGQLKILQADLDASKAELAAMQDRNKSLEELQQQTTSQNEELENEVDELQSLIQESCEEYKVLQRHLDAANANVQNLHLEFISKEKKYETQVKLMSAEAEEKHREMSATQEQSEKQLVEARNHLKLLTDKVEHLQKHLSTAEQDKEKLVLTQTESEKKLSDCLTELSQLHGQMEKCKQDLSESEGRLGEKEKEVITLKDQLKNKEEELSQQIRYLNDKYQQLEEEKGELEEESKRREAGLTSELNSLKENINEKDKGHQKLQEAHAELTEVINREKYNIEQYLCQRSVRNSQELLVKLQEETLDERLQLEGELEEALEELNQLEMKELQAVEMIRHLEEENKQRDQEILQLQAQLHGKNEELERMNKTLNTDVTKLKEEHSSSLRKIGEMATEFESNRVSMAEEIECLTTKNATLQKEIIQVRQQFAEEQKQLAETQQSKEKAKEEYARMLLDAQTKLAQKESELRKTEESYTVELTKLQDRIESREYQEQLKKTECQSKHVVDEVELLELKTEVEKWRTLYEELYSKVKPFQQQLDAYEAEKNALLNEHGAAQVELNNLSDAYAKLLGHQNHKQKIKHVVKLKEQNHILKQQQLDAYEAEKNALLNEHGAAQVELNNLSDAYAKLLGHQNHKQKIKHVVKLKEQNHILKQQQLDAYEAEKNALLNEHGAAQVELNNLSDAYAKLLGHQNHKQKIKHVVKLKEQNHILKQEVAKLQGLLSKNLKEHPVQPGRRFDPSKAFKHGGKENAWPESPLGSVRAQGHCMLGYLQHNSQNAHGKTSNGEHFRMQTVQSVAENVHVPFRRVLVTGATGLLGRAVYKEFQDNDWYTVGCGYSRARPRFEKCNLLDADAVRAMIQEFQENVHVPFRRVLVTGATGLLGRAVYKEFQDNDWYTVGCGYSRARPRFEKCNLLDADAVRAMIQEFQPHVIVHCAAERRPDVVESQTDAAIQLNVSAAGNLAKEAGVSFVIYISTDYVFDGRNPPYDVNDTPNPLNLYGKTNKNREREVLRNNMGKSE
ncbi:UNVERIFIED_CONTAM: hypothetical protein FKN15_035695 [Acipenser sinensis]